MPSNGYYNKAQLLSKLNNYVLKQSPDDVEFTDDSKGLVWTTGGKTLRVKGVIDEGVTTYDVEEIV